MTAVDLAWTSSHQGATLARKLRYMDMDPCKLNNEFQKQMWSKISFYAFYNTRERPHPCALRTTTP